MPVPSGNDDHVQEDNFKIGPAGDDNDGDIEIFEEKSTDEEDETNFLESVAANDILFSSLPSPDKR